MYSHDIDSANDCLSKRRFRGRLFGGHGEGFAAVVDHLTHLADASGALDDALVAGEYLAGTGGARLDGEDDVTLAKTIAVTDVQGTNLTR